MFLSPVPSPFPVQVFTLGAVVQPVSLWALQGSGCSPDGFLGRVSLTFPRCVQGQRLPGRGTQGGEQLQEKCRGEQ